MIRLMIIPIISAFIGYLTNIVAIRMLFRPRYPVNILGYELQGLIPRRQDEIAVKIGEVVERELLSVGDLVDQINTPNVQEKIVDVISGAVRNRLSEAMPKVIPQSVTRVVADSLDKILRREAQALVAQVIESGRAELEEQIKVREIVEDKIMSFEVAEMEGLVREVAGRELKHIEILGGILGFLIGLVQVGIVSIFP